MQWRFQKPCVFKLEPLLHRNKEIGEKSAGFSRDLGYEGLVLPIAGIGGRFRWARDSRTEGSRFLNRGGTARLAAALLQTSSCLLSYAARRYLRRTNPAMPGTPVRMRTRVPGSGVTTGGG